MYQTGRVQAVQHFLGSVVLTTVNVYGFVSGLTFPDAKARTDKLLSDITREVVIGGRGPRAISGDFNHCQSSLEQVAIWQSLGWPEVQEAARRWWCREPCMTCKGTTQRDYIFLSPEALALLADVRVQTDFAEHATVIAGLKLDLGVEQTQSWPLPATIPWKRVSMREWQDAVTPCPAKAHSSTQWLKDFSKFFENSLNGHVQGNAGGQLPSQCFGRAQRLSPAKAQPTLISPKPHRPGEEPLRHGLLCLEVKQWYRQLRRIQNLHYALRSGKSTAEAMANKLHLWRAILDSTGFRDGFQAWYATRRVKFQGMPPQLPACLPSPQFACQLFEDFLENFRRFESWHASQRGQILKAQYEEQRNLLYRDLRDPAPDQVDLLVNQQTFSAVAVDVPSRQLLLDEPVRHKGQTTWSTDGQQVEVQVQGSEVVTVEAGCPLHVDMELDQTVVVSSTKAILEEFEMFWRRRWNKPQGVQDWDRLQAFASAFFTRFKIQLPLISVCVWRDALRRYKPRAARGPDAWSHYDLRNMADVQVQQLLDFLHRIERQECPWPEQWLLGLVISLLKPGRTPREVNAFRPIVILSTIYRTWASIRARQVLKAMEPHMPQGTLGFMPG